jgi:hypothetical protein
MITLNEDTLTIEVTTACNYEKDVKPLIIELQDIVKDNLERIKKDFPESYKDFVKFSQMPIEDNPKLWLMKQIQWDYEREPDNYEESSFSDTWTLMLNVSYFIGEYYNIPLSTVKNLYT